MSKKTLEQYLRERLGTGNIGDAILTINKDKNDEIRLLFDDGYEVWVIGNQILLTWTEFLKRDEPSTNT